MEWITFSSLNKASLTFTIGRDDHQIQNSNPTVVVARDPAHKVVQLHFEQHIAVLGVPNVDFSTLPPDNDLLALAAQYVVHGHRRDPGLRLYSPHSNALVEHADCAIFDAEHKLARADRHQVLNLVALGELVQQRIPFVHFDAPIVRAYNELNGRETKLNFIGRLNEITIITSF